MNISGNFQIYPRFHLLLDLLFGLNSLLVELKSQFKNTIGNFEVTAGLGFGRLAGKDSFSNPLGNFSSHFKKRDNTGTGRGGTLGSINWFQGDAANLHQAGQLFPLKTPQEYRGTPHVPRSSLAC